MCLIGELEAFGRATVHVRETQTSTVLIPIVAAKIVGAVDSDIELSGTRVAAVDPNSPAARADVSARDELRAINGFPASSLGSFSLSLALVQPGGTTLALMVRRADRELRVELRF